MTARLQRRWFTASLVAALVFTFSLFLLAAPRVALAQPSLTPMQPLAGWEVAANGDVSVLDATQRIFALDPQTLAPVAVSARLAPVFSDGAAQIAADGDRLYVRGDAFDRCV